MGYAGSGFTQIELGVYVHVQVVVWSRELPTYHPPYLVISPEFLVSVRPSHIGTTAHSMTQIYKDVAEKHLSAMI